MPKLAPNWSFRSGIYVNIWPTVAPLLPAPRVAEVALAEHHAVKGGGELEVHSHPCLFTRDIQTRDLEQGGEVEERHGEAHHGHVGRLLPLLPEALHLALPHLGNRLGVSVSASVSVSVGISVGVSLHPHLPLSTF